MILEQRGICHSEIGDGNRYGVVKSMMLLHIGRYPCLPYPVRKVSSRGIR